MTSPSVMINSQLVILAEVVTLTGVVAFCQSAMKSVTISWLQISVSSVALVSPEVVF